MNYNSILEALNEASLFELYRLSAAIGNLLDDPERIRAAKRCLQVGQQIAWFNNEENRLVDARVLKINRTRVLVADVADGRRWNLPFYLLNIESQDAEIAPAKRRGMDRNSLKVGDRVAYISRSGREQFGEVLKLNQKTATVQVGPTRWRVGYGLLSPVIEGTLGRDAPALPPGWVQGSGDEEIEDAEILDPQQPGE